MIKQAIFYGEKYGEVFEFDNMVLYKEWFKTIPDGQRLEIIIKSEDESKTLSQIRYYQACIVIPLAEYTGYTKAEMDGVICKRLLTQNIGTKKEYVKSVSKLTIPEMAEFIDSAIHLAAQNGVVVMPPDKFWKTKGAKQKKRTS